MGRRLGADDVLAWRNLGIWYSILSAAGVGTDLDLEVGLLAMGEFLVGGAPYLGAVLTWVRSLFGGVLVDEKASRRLWGGLWGQDFRIL